MARDWANVRSRVGESRERDDEFSFLSFRLHDDFVDQYATRIPAWGFEMGAHNYLGEYAWYTKYSRVKADGTKERFHEGLRRVIEGMYSIQKDHAIAQRLPWSEEKAHRSAEEAYDRAFAGKWSPPGRGFWMMGTEFVNGRGDSSALQNCGFISTQDIDVELSKPFTILMNMSMLGVGVGFDTKGAKKVTLHNPHNYTRTLVVGDSREGWCKSVATLLESFFKPNRKVPVFDYSEIRPAGSPIRGFGGMSAGPEPLIRLHDRLTDLLDNREGDLLTSSDIVDIMNMIGKCIVAANVRSSAEIALGDPYDQEFLSLKDWRINPVRMGMDGWGYTSNNSVIANSGDDLQHLIPSIQLNGEPGIYWMDVVRTRGRLADGYNERDHRAMGVNPCQPDWAKVITPLGISTIGDIDVGSVIWSEDGWVTVTGKQCSGIKPVNRYRTTAGYVDATPNHRIVSNGVKVELQDAESIDRLRGMCYNSNPSPDDVMRGLLLGDGYVHYTHDNPYTILCIGMNDQDYFDSEIAHLIIGTHGKSYHYRVSDVIDPKDLEDKLSDRGIPGNLLGNPSVLRGLYSANGSVVRNRVTFKTTSIAMRDGVQVSLSALGIASYYTTNKPYEVEWVNGQFTSRQSFDVNIGRAVDVARFAKLIGFIQHYKTDKLESILSGSVNTVPDKSFPITVIESLGEHIVWDISVSGDHHTYWSDGMNVSNCGEQPLENLELCTLCETFPTKCYGMSDYIRTLKFAYLYAKSVTLLPTQWPETNEVMIRNRRIGTSMTGIAQFVEDHGWAELRRWQNEGYLTIRQWDEIYSEWLGVRESIRVTTVKPSGTVSLLFGVTPGCHWPKESGYYIRTVREQVDSPVVAVMAAAGYRVEPSESNPDSTVVIYCPVVGPEMRSERDVSVWEKVSIAAHCQRYWSDNSVSITASFDPLTESAQIAPILNAFDGQLKSLSFLPSNEGVYAQAPYIRVSQEEWQAMYDAIMPIDWQSLYNQSVNPEGERYCSNDVCEVL